ncbi:SAM-dependent methyltransferase [Minicystis rosea]|nr:SAM-dependent methyltransferase [Minicystis rosea]
MLTEHAISARTLYEEDLAFVQASAFGDHAAGAAGHIVSRFRVSRVPVRHVIDLGCGAGVTTRALVDAGFSVTAVEPSPWLLEAARAAAPRATFHQASAYDVDLAPCEAILAVGEVLTYHDPDADAEARVRALFERVARALPPSGHFVFDVIGVDGPALDARSWRSDEAWAILVDTRDDRDTRAITRSIEVFRRVGDAYRRSREVHHVRAFDERTLASMLDEVGFDVETARAYGDTPLLPRRVAFFATRRAQP